ncbi:hypothetical protein YC2023_115133 [Brassica napus]
MANFNLICVCSAIVLGNTHFHTSTLHSKSYLGFLVVWREDPRLFKRFVLELQFFYLILSMQFIQIFGMFCFTMSE